MHKKRKLILIIVTALLIISVVVYATYHNSSFVEKNYQKYTGIEKFEVKKKYSDNHQSYIETEISDIDKKIILGRFAFENSLHKLKGKVQCPYISENANHIYFVITDGYGPYGYVLFSLEKAGNGLNVYEFYGN